MTWLQQLRYRKRLTPIEEGLIEELKRRLEGEGATLLGEQVKKVNLVQRHANGRETCLYAMRGGRPHRDPSIRFPTNERELRLATIQFDVPEAGRFAAEFHLVDGFLFSIDFTPTAAGIMTRDDFVVRKVTIHHDPFAPPSTAPGPPEGIAKGDQSRGWLTEAPWSNEVRDRHRGLNAAERGRLGEIVATLPNDYVSALEVSNGFAFHDVKVLSLSDVYEIVLEEANYYVLALVGDWGVLAIRKHSSDGMVYRIPFDDVGTPVASSIREALLVADRDS